MFLLLFLSLNAKAAEWLPDTYAGQQESTPVSEKPWWMLIDSPNLSTDIQKAFESNAQITMSNHAAKAMDYNAQLLLASVLPVISIGASSNTISCDTIGQFGPCITDFSAIFSPNPPEEAESYSQGTYAIRAGLRVDTSGSSFKLWNAAKKDASANREDAKQVKLELAKQIAGVHGAIGAAKEQMAVIEDQIALNRRLLKIVRFKYDSGEATAVDLLQQEQSLARAIAQAPMVEQAWNSGRKMLAVLLSQAKKTPLGPQTIPPIPPKPNIGSPKDLIQNHASLKALQKRIDAAHLRVLPKYQNLFPIINLQGSYGQNWNHIDGRSDVESLGLEDRESIKNWVMGVSIDLPVFDGGVSYNQSAIAQERLGIAKSQYDLALRSAVMTVENTYESNLALEKQLESLKDLSAKAEQTWNNAKTNYDAGLIGFQQVQGALSGLLTARLTEINARYALFDARLQLFSAIGGPWTQTKEWNSQ